MCMVALAVAAQVGAGLAQAGGQAAAGVANKRIADANAANLELSAKDADERARLDGEILRQQIGQRIGHQRPVFMALYWPNDDDAVVSSVLPALMKPMVRAFLPSARVIAAWLRSP